MCYHIVTGKKPCIYREAKPRVRQDDEPRHTVASRKGLGIKVVVQCRRVDQNNGRGNQSKEREVTIDVRYQEFHEVILDRRDKNG